MFLVKTTEGTVLIHTNCEKWKYLRYPHQVLEPHLPTQIVYVLMDFFFYLFIDTFLSGNELLHQEVCIYIYIQENEKALQWGSHIMFMII